MGYEDQHDKLRLLVCQLIERDGYQISEMARKLNISQPTLSRYLRCSKRISMKLMAHILKALDIDESLLLSTEPVKQQIRLHTVPLIDQSTAISTPFITSRKVDGEIMVDSARLIAAQVSCDRSRLVWTRFVAVRLNTLQRRFSWPLFGRHSIIVIDRHHQRAGLKTRGRFPFHAVADGKSLLIGYVTQVGQTFIVRPEASEIGLRVLDSVPSKLSANVIVGRIVASHVYF